MTGPGPDIDTARQVLADQPFSVLLGARLTAFEPGRAALALDIRYGHKQQNGFVHGGVLAYLADNAITFAAGTVLGASTLTSGLTISYVRPAAGAALEAEAAVTSSGRRQAVCRCDVFAVATDGTRTLCAVAQGTATVVARPDGPAARDAE